MTNLPKNDDEKRNDIDGVGRLISYAGAREGVPTETMNNARDRVAAHWKGVVAKKRDQSRRGVPLWFAVAASVTVTAGLAFLLTQFDSPEKSVVVASVDSILGDVYIEDVAIRPGDTIQEGSRIETGVGGRVSLRMANGQSLRIDRSSEMHVHSPDHVSLQSGALYVDSDGTPDYLPILVSTSIATVQDIGTQFQVRIVGSTLVVGVREGSVAIEQPGRSDLSITQGLYVELGQNARGPERQLRSDDPIWAWVEAFEPDAVAQKRTLDLFLVRYANEKGLKLQWVDSISQARAQAIELSGSVDGATIDESLEIVHGIAEFEITTEGESLRVKIE